MGQFKPVSEPFSELANPRFFTTYLFYRNTKKVNLISRYFWTNKLFFAMSVVMYVLHIAILIV